MIVGGHRAVGLALKHLGVEALHRLERQHDAAGGAGFLQRLGNLAGRPKDFVRDGLGTKDSSGKLPSVDPDARLNAAPL